jgi:hypothetical protein
VGALEAESADQVTLSASCGNPAGSVEVKNLMTARGRVRIRVLVASALLAAGAGGLLSGCSSTPIPPTYTEEELKRKCEMRACRRASHLGYCEFQAASLQAP